ncbi:MAG: ATP-dependent DNA helicase RecG [Lachnospiraceae bacterium]|nr:ATP-dependent DNA helicase RecG [Lachnospiraceae bacterium]
MTDLKVLKGIGEKTASYYGRLGINTVEDAVYYYPRDYIRYEPPCSGTQLKCDVTVAFEAVVAAHPLVRKVKRLSITSAKLSVDGILVTATWFNMPYLSKSLTRGKSFVFRGRLSAEGDHYHIEQPQIFKEEAYREMLGHINPVYSLTKGLSNQAMTKTVKNAFDCLGDTVESEVYDMHFPKDEKTLERARTKLVFEEFLIFMLRLKLLRKDEQFAKNDFNIIESAQCERIIERLPYRLTDAQSRVWSEIKQDLCSNRSMHRLIQGDVGSGKTVLAILSAIMVAVNKHQCAIMAPTEILAAQHYESIKKIIRDSDLDINVVLLTGSMTEASKKNVRALIEDGSADIIIGTHALFYEKVIYSDLALVITDEQHRFGVGQRSRLSSKNPQNDAHVLVMSATPIPRTLALIMYGDLDISVIDEVPSHKLPIKNAVVNESFRQKAYEFMEKEIRAHHQVYVICPLIEASEGLDVRNVTDTAKMLSERCAGDIRVGMLHGRMKASDKQKIMDEFANGCIDILVSTTVVEVGVNVPNATVMMIEDADRFGLAALHQLRGRIGRGIAQSYCIFMSQSSNPNTMKRLEILKRSNDGFKIAQEDLKQRGPGELFGFRQSGDIRFKLGDIYTDSALLSKASEEADRILRDDPDLLRTENKRYRSALEAADLFSVSASL